MSHHKKYNWTELIPLLSFFVGVVVIFISQYINSSLTCHGSWPDLANGLKSFLIYFISMIFASFICILLLVFAVANKTKCQKFSLISFLSCLLNGGYVVTMLIIYYVSI